MNNNPLRYVDPFGLCGEEQGSPRTAGRYKSAREAGEAALRKNNQPSIDEDLEYSGMIYLNTKAGSYDYTTAIPTDQSKSNRPNPKDLGPGQKLEGIWHTHGAETWGKDDWKFSPEDKLVADQFRVPMYLATPQHTWWEYNPGSYDPSTKGERVLRKGW